MAPEGVIIGGWSFVVAAYVVTAAGLVLYAWSLRSRLNKIQSRIGNHERDHG
ncbi:MAG TPA: CcmD family protein [Thermoanaerobaculia bacterium]|nr:CcmD family protein [Thermoanaerobaculia bacterium]